MARGIKRAVTTVCSLLAVVLIITIYSSSQLQVSSSYLHEWIHLASESTSSLTNHLATNRPQQPLQEGLWASKPKKRPTPGVADTHVEIFSQSRKDGRYYPIKFGDYEAINPNMIPHPQLQDTWILVAQQQRSDIKGSVWFAELSCNAIFEAEQISCSKSPLTLPISRTGSDKCVGELEHFRWSIGPHDARVSFGPMGPYTIYGSLSEHTCFGLWMQDLRTLVDWGRVLKPPTMFWDRVDLQRPPPYGLVEKNWFPFWDLDGKMYLHYDIAPQRVFTEVSADGSIGEDVSIMSRAADGACLAKYLPKLPPELESIHQATNSLSITFCKRSDPDCRPSMENTFVLSIFQHKTFYNLHSVYEPYVMLFRQTSPFSLYGISSKPIWIHGRGVRGEKRPARASPDVIWTHTEMFYVTSINWKQHGLGYHGYLDDEIMLGFGIEDESSAVIDVLADDLLQSLGTCE